MIFSASHKVFASNRAEETAHTVACNRSFGRPKNRFFGASFFFLLKTGKIRQGRQVVPGLEEKIPETSPGEALGIPLESIVAIITFTSLKGGVGKSTDAILLANNLAARGKKVLVFDMDINNSSTIYYTMGIADEFPQRHAAAALSNRSVEGCTVQSRIENVDIVPSSLRLCDIRSIDYHVLKKTLSASANKYDHIVIDTSPYYDNITMNAIWAADLILTPIVVDFYNITTTKFMRAHLYDEMEEKVGKWFIFYSFWEKTLESFPNSMQSQYAAVYESEFENILDVQVPKTSAVSKYTQADVKLSSRSKLLGAKRLLDAFNQFANIVTGEEDSVERF